MRHYSEHDAPVLFARPEFSQYHGRGKCGRATRATRAARAPDIQKCGNFVKKPLGKLKNIVGSQANRAKVLARIDDLPSSPVVAAQIDRLTYNPDTPISAIENLIKQDLALVAKLLRLVNSPFFGLRNRVNSVRLAISMLGNKTIRNLVFAVTTNPILTRRLPAYGYDRAGLWTHSLAAAAAATVIGRELDGAKEEVDELFVMGLLHDIGKLVLGEFLAHLDLGGLGDARAFLEKEREITGFDHGELGALIAERWNLSKMFTEVIKNYHTPSPDMDYAKSIAAVHLADVCARRLGCGFLPEFENVVQADPSALAVCGVEGQFMDDIMPKVAAEMEKLKEVFQIPNS